MSDAPCECVSSAAFRWEFVYVEMCPTCQGERRVGWWTCVRCCGAGIVSAETSEAVTESFL